MLLPALPPSPKSCGVREAAYFIDKQRTSEDSLNFASVKSMEVVKRRLELLKLEGLGLTQAEIVKQLSEKNRMC